VIGSVIGALVVGLIGVFAIDNTVALGSNVKLRTGLSRGTLNFNKQANPELAGAGKLWASVETLHPAS